MRAIFQWNVGSRVLELGRRTLVMGVVNVTPDSFSDGGCYLDPARALTRAEQLLADGASIIDIGGESTRPGAQVIPDEATHKNQVSNTGPRVRTAVPEAEEQQRVLPVIRELRLRHPEAMISVDTYKSGVARAAIEAGADIVNDISGFRWDPKMAKTIASLNAGAVLMHVRGRPEEWRTLPPIGDPVLLVKRELRQSAEGATLAGIRRDHLVLDPGFGFGKNFEENYPLLARFAELQQLGFPLAVARMLRSTNACGERWPLKRP
jgi:dihydropteroate synthase